MLDLSKIIQVDFPEDQYYREIREKKQIVIHHTVSGPTALGDINYWLSNPSKIATCIVIDRTGEIYQCFSSKYWAHHLGVKEEFLQEKGFSDYITRNVKLNKESIGIEIDNWGWLKNKEGVFYNAYNKEVDVPVQEYPNKFRGERYYEKYTPKQISSLHDLLSYLCQKYNIPTNYNEDMWNVSMKALSSTPGIWTHISYRPDKSDCHPQDELINMLKSL